MLLGGATLARPLTARAQLAEKVSRIGVLAYESLFGAEHLITAYARGALAVGLQRAGQLEQARQEFRRAIPTIISARSGGGEDDALLVAAREQRTRMLVESYLALLARNPDQGVATESFQLADAIRSRAIQKALTQSRGPWRGRRGGGAWIATAA